MRSENKPQRQPDATGRSQGPAGAVWAAVVVWGVLVPAACLVLGLLLARQRAQETALATEAARSAGELATVQHYLYGPAQTATLPVDLPATWAAAPAPAPALPSVTPAATAAAPTATRVSFITRTVTPLRTATATSTPVGELVIGHSVAGRPITVTQFGSGPVVRLIVAGIHGGSEWNTTALADELIAYLREQPVLVPEDVSLYILRALNPDGAARGTGIYARANDNNVDLNRNWPDRWQADWARHGCWRHLLLSGGLGPGSEPETQSLMAFLRTHAVDAVISYHSAALGIFAGGQPPDAASLSLAEAVAAVSDYPYPALDFGCVYTGQLIDWASEQGIAALDIELTNHRDTDFDQNLRILEVFLAWRR